jgi:replicative DNA helicase
MSTPSSSECECALLGAILVDAANAMPMLAQVGVRPLDFTDPTRATIYRAMQDVWQSRNNMCDFVMVTEHLKRTDQLSDIDIGLTLDDLVNNTIPAHASYYAETVMDYSRRRDAVLVADQLRVDAATAPTWRTALEKAEAGLAAIGPDTETATRAATQADILARWDRAAETGAGGLPSRFHQLTELTGGYAGYTILAARPAVGKTNFTLNEAKQLAAAGYPAGVVSVEQTNSESWQRIASDVGNVNLWRLQTGNASDAQREQASKALETAMALPIHIADDLTTVEAVCGWSRRMVSRHGLRIIFIDYLQLLSTTEPTSNNNVRIEHISRSLLRLRKQLDIPIVALSQLSRSCQAEGRPPRLSDLRDSGSLEQDASLVLLLSNSPDSDQTVIVDVAKNRSGPLAQFELTKDFQRCRFEDKTE